MNYSERVCRLYNEVIPNVVELNRIDTNLIDLKLYHNYNRFTLRYSIKEEYSNPKILYKAILETTDKLLDWLDLSSLDDGFQIRIDYLTNPKYVVFENYYELMCGCYSSAFDPYVPLHSVYYNLEEKSVYNHPRYKQLVEYLKMKKYQEERRKFQMEESIPSKNIEELQRTLFGKIKNKLVDLLHV
jgi:hypothetical protein